MSGVPEKDDRNVMVYPTDTIIYLFSFSKSSRDEGGREKSTEI